MTSTHVYPITIHIYNPRAIYDFEHDRWDESYPKDVRKDYSDGRPPVWIKSITSIALRKDKDILAFSDHTTDTIKEVLVFHGDPKSWPTRMTWDETTKKIKSERIPVL